MKKIIIASFTTLFTVFVLVPVAKGGAEYVVMQGLTVTVIGTITIALCYLSCRFLYKILKAFGIKLYNKLYEFFQ